MFVLTRITEHDLDGRLGTHDVVIADAPQLARAGASKAVDAIAGAIANGGVAIVGRPFSDQSVGGESVAAFDRAGFGVAPISFTSQAVRFRPPASWSPAEISQRRPRPRPPLSRTPADRALVTCPLCGWTGREFQPAGRVPRPNARCARCNSLERHRAMFLYLRDETRILTEPTRLLHFAPEPALAAVFERPRISTMSTTDIVRSNVSIRMDIEYLLFRDDVFDCVIISHVEHVPDDHAAMASSPGSPGPTASL